MISTGGEWLHRVDAGYWDRATDPHLAMNRHWGDTEGPAHSSAAEEFMQRDGIPAEETSLRVLTPFQERRRATVAVSYSLSDLGPLTKGLSRR